MSDLTPEVLKAIEESKAKILDAPRDLRELIEIEKKKESNATPEKEPEKKDDPATAKKETKKELSKEDLSNVTDLLGSQLGFRKEKKKEDDSSGGEEAIKAKKAADDLAAAKAKEEADKKETEDKKVEESKKLNIRKKVEKPEVDLADFGASVAAKVGKEIANELRKEPEKKQPDENDLGIDLSDDEKSELEVFKEMAKANPAYKGLPEKYVQSIKKIDQYKTKWEAANPDKEFDPQDEEHNDFYSRVTPTFNARDFRSAEVRLEAAPLLKKEQEKTQAEQAQLKAELAQKELEPVIMNTKIEAAAKVLETINPDYLKMVGESKDGFEKFQNQDPVAAQALAISAQRLGSFIEAARQIDEPKARIRVDINNPAHASYINYLIAKEDEMKGRPLKDQIDDKGRRFVTRQEAIKIPPEDRNRVWFYKDSDLISLRIQEEAEFAKDFVTKENERIEKVAKLRGWKIDSASKESQKKEPEKKEPDKKEPEKETKVSSPAAGSGGKVDVTEGNDKKNDSDFLDKSASILFRR